MVVAPLLIVQWSGYSAFCGGGVETSVGVHYEQTVRGGAGGGCRAEQNICHTVAINALAVR